MKKAPSNEERKIREAQAAEYKAADWIRVTFANGNTRMITRAAYNALKAAQS